MSNEKPPDQRQHQESTKQTCPICEGTGKRSFPDGKRESMCGTCKGKGFIYT